MNSCLLLTVSMALLGLSWADFMLYEEDIFLVRIQLMTNKAIWMVANHNGKCPNKMEVPAAAIICSSADEPACHVVFSCMTILKPRYISEETKSPLTCSYGQSPVWEEAFCHVHGFTVQCKRHLQCMWIKRGDVDEETSPSEKDYIEYDYPELYPAMTICNPNTEYAVWLEGGLQVCKYGEQDVTCDYTYTCAKTAPDVIGVNMSETDEPKPQCNPGEIVIETSHCVMSYGNVRDCQIHWICASFSAL